MKWLGNKSDVDQFLWKIGNYSGQVYRTNRSQGEPDSSLLILSPPQYQKKLRDFKKLPIPRKDKEVPERTKNWLFSIVNLSTPPARETNGKGQENWVLDLGTTF